MTPYLTDFVMASKLEPHHTYDREELIDTVSYKVRNSLPGCRSSAKGLLCGDLNEVDVSLVRMRTTGHLGGEMASGFRVKRLSIATPPAACTTRLLTQQPANLLAISPYLG